MTEGPSEQAGQPPIRVFLVDDHEIVRDGLRALLEAQSDMVVVGEAAGAVDALRHIPPTNPDVAVVDVNLPDGDGVQVCRELRDRLPDLQSLILTSYADDEALLDAIIAGAAGYVLKQVRSSDLVSCIRRVAAGETLLSPELRARVSERLRLGADQDPRLAALTGQERRILDLLGEGLTNREIADRMHLAEKTVKNYVSNLLMKMGMARRTEAAAFSARIAERRQQRSARPGDDVDPIRY